MSDLMKELHEPNLDGMTPKQANAYLLGLCQDAAKEITHLRADVEALRKGEFVCAKCGIRKNDEHPRQDF